MEKQLSGILYERGVDRQGFAIIRSKGDQALFRLNTQMLKRKMGIPDSRPVADFLPTISMKAKDLANIIKSRNELNDQTLTKCMVLLFPYKYFHFNFEYVSDL